MIIEATTDQELETLEQLRDVFDEGVLKLIARIRKEQVDVANLRRWLADEQQRAKQAESERDDLRDALDTLKGQYAVLYDLIKTKKAENRRLDDRINNLIQDVKKEQRRAHKAEAKLIAWSKHTGDLWDLTQRWVADKGSVDCKDFYHAVINMFQNVLPEDQKGRLGRLCERCGNDPCPGCEPCCGSTLGRSDEDGSCLGCG